MCGFPNCVSASPQSQHNVSVIVYIVQRIKMLSFIYIRTYSTIVNQQVYRYQNVFNNCLLVGVQILERIQQLFTSRCIDIRTYSTIVYQQVYRYQNVFNNCLLVVVVIYLLKRCSSISLTVEIMWSQLFMVLTWILLKYINNSVLQSVCAIRMSFWYSMLSCSRIKFYGHQGLRLMSRQLAVNSEMNTC